MEEMTETPKALLWGLCDKAVFAGTFQAAIEFELIVLQWAMSHGYPKKKIAPSLKGAIHHLKHEGRLSQELFQQMDAARETRNDLMHNFAWKSLLLGPEQSQDCILLEAQKTLVTAWFAVKDACCRSAP
jgi:hypothetical protein